MRVSGLLGAITSAVAIYFVSKGGMQSIFTAAAVAFLLINLGILALGLRRGD